MTAALDIDPRFALATLRPGDRVTLERLEGETWWPIDTLSVARLVGTRKTVATKNDRARGQSEWSIADGFPIHGGKTSGQRIRRPRDTDAGDIGRLYYREQVARREREEASRARWLSEREAETAIARADLLAAQEKTADARAEYVAKGGTL